MHFRSLGKGGYPLRTDDQLLEAALGECKRCITDPGEGDRAKSPAQVARALAYIHRHLFDPGLNAASVRAGCGVRNHNLTTLFHRTLGITLRDYIESQRLAAAARLLRTLQLEAFWIAAAVGYESYETFCRAFRRRFQCTPSQFRGRPGD